VRRHVVQEPRRLGREGLHAAQRHGVEEEEREAHPHGRDRQEVERLRRAAAAVPRLRGAAIT
jgi:hypothetical protein